MQFVVSRSSVAPNPRALRVDSAARPRQQKRAAVNAVSSSSDGADGKNEHKAMSLGRRLQQAAVGVAAGAVLAVAPPAMARLEGVNNPQMLPPGDVQEVLDVAGYLTKGEITRLTQEVKNLEKDTAGGCACWRKPIPTRQDWL